jgi:hypothetical protein
MFLPAFLLEVMDKLPTVEYMYVSGIILALLVFAATYFHRQVGLISLILVGFLCVQDLETPDVVDGVIKEAGQNYINHWHFSCRLTLILSVILFFAAIILKRRLKQKNKLD